MLKGLKKIGEFLFINITKLRNHQNLSEIGWLICGQVISISLGFISMKLLSSMGATEFGKYSLVLSIAALVSALLYGPAEQGFVRFYYEYLNKGQSKTYIALFYKFLAVTGFCCFGITILSIPVSVLMGNHETITGIVIMGVYIIISTSSNIYNSMLNILRKRKINTFLQVTERSLTILFVYLVAHYTKITAQSALSAILIALIIIIGVKTTVLNIYIPEDTDNLNQVGNQKKIMKVITSFGIPFAIWGLTGWLQSSSERWVIAHYLSTADVGIYSIMAILANYLIAIPSGIISQFAEPIIYERNLTSNDGSHQSQGAKALNYYVIAIIALVVVSTILSLILGKQLILLVSNKEFAAHWYILPILCVGIGVFNIAQSLTIVGIIKNTPKKYLFPKIFTGFFAVVFNILLIKQFGILGIALSICAASFVYIALVKYTNHKFKITL